MAGSEALGRPSGMLAVMRYDLPEPMVNVALPMEIDCGERSSAPFPFTHCSVKSPTRFGKAGFASGAVLGAQPESAKSAARATPVARRVGQDIAFISKSPVRSGPFSRRARVCHQQVISSTRVLKRHLTKASTWVRVLRVNCAYFPEPESLR